MKFKMDIPPADKNVRVIDKNSPFLPEKKNSGILIEQTKDIEFEKSKPIIRVPLSEEEKNFSFKELADKYNITTSAASYMKKRGYSTINNPEFKSKDELRKDEIDKKIEFIKETTPVEIQSIESCLGNEKEQEEIRNVVESIQKYKYSNGRESIDNLYSKKFKLLNGQELTIGDFIVLEKIIESKMFRNQDGVLMVFNSENNQFIPFKRSSFLTKRGGLNYKDLEKKTDNSRHAIYSLESLAPNIFKTNLFNEKDFELKVAGSPAFEIYGPHERKLSAQSPYAFLSNEEVSAKYYIGRYSFASKDKKINHETVRVSLLDNNTGVVTDTINGRKLILYTFPLISKDDYEKQKEEVAKRRMSEGKSTDVNINDYITTKAELKEYSIKDYITKNLNEPEEKYTDKISKLSDTSYVLGNFKSFMSETGLAANNYSWREQLILADALTSVESKEKIVNFGKNFGKNGLRTFLSVEQGGSTMGDKIIELTNILPKEILKDIFEGYASLLDEAGSLKDKMSSVKEIEGVSPELVEKIPSQIYNALLLRTKDILLGSHILAKKGELKGLNILNVREATDGVSLMLKILNDIKKEENFSFKEINRTEQNFKYEIKDKKTENKYGLKIFLRPKAEKNAQARVNIELSFDTDNPNVRLQKAFSNKIESHTQNKTMNGSVLRVGIDREERNGGQVSLDIGRSAHEDEELTRTGDVLGNLLAVASEQGHHTTESFDPRFAEEENFAQIVKLFENYLGGQKN